MLAAAGRMDNGGRAAIWRGMTQSTDIVIVGGGLNGPALALALAQAGFGVTVIDAQPPARPDAPFDGRAYALSLASVRLMRRLGLWEALAPDAQPMLEIKVTDGRAGEGPAPFWMHFDHAEIEEGPMGHMVEDRHLRPVLSQALAEHPDITHLQDARVVDQQVSGGAVTVKTADGEAVSGAVLIGCDGRSSGTAERAGIGRTGWGYDQTALVCAVRHDKPHGGVAHQFFMPGGPLAILPLTGDRSSIVWSENAGRAAEIAALDDAGFLEALRPAFGSFLGEIALDGVRSTFPLGLTLANRLVADRVALVGDAAHGIHPIAGQGLNAGLRDVAALAEVLTAARQRGEDVGSAGVLARYADWRGADAAKLAMATDAFNRLFSNDNPLLRAARDLGMGAISALPGLRRRFIREAAGLTGRVPPLMR